MNGVLAAYLRRRVAAQIVGLLLLLTALTQVLELLDVTTDILDRGLGAAGLLRYALLRAPAELVLTLPLAVLLGAITTFHAMSRSHEIVAVRCAGQSLSRIWLMLLPVPLLLGAMQFALSERVVPAAETELKRWWDATAPASDQDDPRWVRTREGPVAIQGASPDGTRLRGLRIYLRDDDGRYTRRIHAQEAGWDGSQWRLRGVVETAVSTASAQRRGEAERVWQTRLRPDDVLRLDVVQPHLSSMMLVDVIVGERVGAQPLSYYQTVLLRAFTAPLGGLIMLLLAMPPAATMARGGAGGGRLLVALALGLAYLLCDGLMAAMGTGGRIPAALAAFGAPLLFAAIGIVQLTLTDRK